MAEKTPKAPNEKFGFVGGNYLQSILDKDPSAVTDEEREVLRARRSYLKQSQIKEFGLDVEEESDEQSREDELKAMPEKILKLTAKEAGIEVKRGMKSPAIIAAILEAEAAAEESEEESDEESEDEEESE